MDKKIEEFAVSQGYVSASYLCEWNGFSCYEPISELNEVSFTGLPLLILVDQYGDIRMSTPDEALKQINDME